MAGPAGPNQGLPEIIRVKALRGFRANISAPAPAGFGVANKGDVVEVPKAEAIDLRAAQKAIMVDEPLNRQTEAQVLARRSAEQAGGTTANVERLRKELADAEAALEVQEAAGKPAGSKGAKAAAAAKPD